MIFHLDEHVSERFTELAERSGLDVTSIDRLGLKGLDDASNILLAAQTGRVLVTYDVRDYTLLHHAWQIWSSAWMAEHPPQHAGIALIHSDKRAGFDGIVAALIELGDAIGVAANRLFVWNYGKGWTEIT
jgi:hypothetical protein